MIIPTTLTIVGSRIVTYVAITVDILVLYSPSSYQNAIFYHPVSLAKLLSLYQSQIKDPTSVSKLFLYQEKDLSISLPWRRQ